MLGLTRLEILQPSRLLTDRMKNETEEIWREEMATPTQSYPKTHLKNPFPAPNKNYFGADQISEAKNQPHPVSKPKSPTYLEIGNGGDCDEQSEEIRGETLAIMCGRATLRHRVLNFVLPNSKFQHNLF